MSNKQARFERRLAARRLTEQAIPTPREPKPAPLDTRSLDTKIKHALSNHRQVRVR